MGFQGRLGNGGSSSVTFYLADSNFSSDRTGDMDGNFVRFEDGSFFAIDNANDGFYYDFITQRIGIGNSAPVSKVHITGNPGENVFLAEDSSGIDVFWVDQNGVAYFRSTSGVENIELRSTGGNTTRIRNNSNQMTMTSVGLFNIETNNGGGAGFICAGHLTAPSTYVVDQRRIQFFANFNDVNEIIYADFQSDTGIQTATFGSSDAEEMRYDLVTWYAEQFVVSGILNNNFVDDTAAAAGNVPIGGLYRNGNAVQIRVV